MDYVFYPSAFCIIGKLYGYSKESHALNISWLMGCLFDILGSRKTFSFLNYVLSFARALQPFPFIPSSYTNFTHLLFSRFQSVCVCVFVYVYVCVCVSRSLALFIHKIFILHPSSEDGFYERENAVVASDNKSNNFAHCTATEHIPYRSVCCWVSSVALGHFICATANRNTPNKYRTVFFTKEREFPFKISFQIQSTKIDFFFFCSFYSKHCAIYIEGKK